MTTATTVPTFETDGTFVAATTNDGTVSGDAGLTLALPNTVTATTAVAVTAWVDANGNDVIDSTEHVSPTQTVTFYAASALTATVTLNSPAIADTKLKGSVNFAPALNGTYSTNVDVQFAWD